MPTASPRKRKQPTAEIQLLQAAWRWGVLILLLGLLGTGLGFVWTKRSIHVYKAQAEILVRYAYEYTPQNAGSGNDSMQVRIDADLALNSEVQLLISPPVIAAALEKAPRPQSPQEKAQGRKLDFEEATKKLLIARLEGTNIISVAVVDRQREWAKNFASALVDAYLARRETLFSTAEEMQVLQARKLELQEEIHGLETRSIALRNELRQGEGGESEDIFRIWATAGVELIDAAERAGKTQDPAATSTGAALQVDPQISLLGRLLQEFLAQPDIGGATAATTDRPSPAPKGGKEPIATVEAQTTRINEAAENIAALERRRQKAIQSLSRMDDLIEALEFRSALDQRIEIMTPPYLLKDPVGLNDFQKIALSGALGLMLGLFVAVLLEGTKAAGLRRS